MMLTAALPKEWGANGANGDQPTLIEEGQELSVVLIDVQGSFSVYKFVQKLRDYYERNRLFEASCPEQGFENEEQRNKALCDDKHLFIRTVLNNLFIFNCMDAIELNLTVRSLSSFFKNQKNVGLVILDGLQFIENSDLLQKKEKHALNEQ